MAFANPSRNHATAANPLLCLAALSVLILAVWIAFGHGLNSPFIFDDSMTVSEESIDSPPLAANWN